MRVASVLKWTGIALAAVLAAAFAILHSIDVDSYRGKLSTEFRKATGRDLAIGGIDLSMSLNPAIVVERLAIANAAWGSRPVMATIERAEARIDLIPLLWGETRFGRLILVEPDILLEFDADGVSNWRFGPPSDGGSPAAYSAGGAGPQPEAAHIPVFDNVEVLRGRLAYRDGRTGEELRLDLTELSAKSRSFAAPLTIAARGSWNDAPFSVSGSIDSLAGLTSGETVELALEAEAFGFDARLTGSVARLDELGGVDLRVTIHGEDLSSLAPAAGPGMPKLGPVDLAADLEGDGERIEVHNFRLAIASSDLSGHVVLFRGGSRPRVTGTVTSAKLDLNEWLSSLETRAPDAARNGSGSVRPGRVFPDKPLPLEVLKAADVDLELSVGRVITPLVQLSDVKARARLHDGALAVEPFSGSVAGSRVNGTARLDTDPETPTLGLALNASNLDLGGLLKEAGVTDLFDGNAKLSAELSGAGRSVASLMAGLNGEVRLVSGAGRLRTETLDAVVGGAGAVLDMLLSGRRRWTVVNCAAASILVVEGRATSRATLVDTEYSTVIARGNLDLARETLNLTVEPRAKSATLNVAVPVHIQGTLAEPSFRPDTSTTLRKLGGLVGIAVFPPAAIIGLLELGVGDNECLRIATANAGAGAKAAPSSGSVVPVSPEETLERLREGAEGVVKGLEHGLKGLLHRSKE